MSTNLDPQIYEKEKRLQQYIQYDWEIDLNSAAGYVNYFAIVENYIKTFLTSFIKKNQWTLGRLTLNVNPTFSKIQT